MSEVATLAPHLTKAKRDDVLAREAGKTKEQIKELVATLAPRPDAKPVLWKLPAPRKPSPSWIDASYSRATAPPERSRGTPPSPSGTSRRKA